MEYTARGQWAGQQRRDRLAGGSGRGQVMQSLMGCANEYGFYSRCKWKPGAKQSQQGDVLCFMI